MLSRRLFEPLALLATIFLVSSLPASRGEDCDNDGVDDAVGLTTCPIANVVFLIDTSASTNPDVGDVCRSIRAALDELGAAVNAEILAIGSGNLGLCVAQDPGDCCSGTVADAYGTATAGLCEELGSCGGCGQGDCEDWGTGARIIVPMSDEGPRCGDAVDLRSRVRAARGDFSAVCVLLLDKTFRGAYK